MALMVAQNGGSARVRESQNSCGLRRATRGNRLPVLRRRSQVVRQRSAKPPFVGSIPTGASVDHKHLGPPDRGLFSRLGRFLGRFFENWDEPTPRKRKGARKRRIDP